MDSQDDNDKNVHARKSSRRRLAVFGERQPMSLRMGIRLNERMMSYCDSVHQPANTYVHDLIAQALQRIDPAAGVEPFGFRGEKRMTLTLRLEPPMHERLLEYCSRSGQSVNAFVCNLVNADLRRRGF